MKHILNTYICYTYAVHRNQNDPFYEMACDTEECLINADEFIEAIQIFNPYLGKLVDESPVTDVLIMRAW